MVFWFTCSWTSEALATRGLRVVIATPFEPEDRMVTHQSNRIDTRKGGSTACKCLLTCEFNFEFRTFHLFHSFSVSLSNLSGETVSGAELAGFRLKYHSTLTKLDMDRK